MYRCLLILLILVFAGVSASAETVTVFAAASLTTAIEELARGVPNGISMRLSVGSSSTLARQIEHGAPADIYLSANRLWMDYLEERDLLAPGSRSDLVGNSLVVIAPRGAETSIVPRKKAPFASEFSGRLALGDPSHVPAGMYAKQALTWMGWWKDVKDRLAPAADVRGALIYVSRGQCPLGIVYATDASVVDDVVIVGTFPDSSYDTIVYPLAVVAGRQRESVRETVEFLRSEKAMRVYERLGFRRVEKERGGEGETGD